MVYSVAMQNYSKYRFIAVLAVSIIAFLLIIKGCGIRSSSDLSPDAQAVSGDDLPQIKERGKLVVLTENSSTSFFIYRGEPMGFEYELLERLAEHLDLELEIVIADDMNDIFNELNTGKADLIACNLTITKERAEKVSFTDPYLVTKQVLVQRKPDYWEKMSDNELEEYLISSTIDLIDQEVHVRENSSFYDRLVNLSDEGGRPNSRHFSTR